MTKNTKIINKLKNKNNGGAIDNVLINIPQTISRVAPLSSSFIASKTESNTESRLFTFENMVFVIYLIICVGVSEYIKTKLSFNYTNLLLGLTYSTRNQDICGHTPIERDTIRYTMDQIINNKKTKESSSQAFGLIWLSLSVGCFFILWYFITDKLPDSIKLPKFFNNTKSYVTNLVLIITMGFAIAFWATFSNQISKTTANEIYVTKKNQILSTTLLPKPRLISTASIENNIGNKNLPLADIGDDATDTSINALYNTLFKRMMYVDNLFSYQDGINKWNSFTTNADIFPYLIFSNYNTNNITSDSIKAKDILDIWNNELLNNQELANSTPPTEDLNCIEKLSLDYTTPSITKLKIVYNNYDSTTDKLLYTHTDKNTPTTHVQIFNTQLHDNTIDYINTNVLPFINSKNNIKGDANYIPSNISGITYYLTVLVGTQNIDNDYTILYNYVKNNLSSNETIQNLYWLSSISNGDPQVEINNAMYINKILFYIINVLIYYLPFHFIYNAYGGLFTIILGTALLTIFIIFYKIYISYKIKQADIAMFNKNNTF